MSTDVKDVVAHDIDPNALEAVARAIYDGRNGPGATPWARLQSAHKHPYRLDARFAIIAYDASGVEVRAFSRLLEAVESRATAAEGRVALLEEALGKLVDAEALAGVRSLVAGWNGETRPDGPYTHRHPDTLRATLPTNCGAVYALDEALQAARSRLAKGGQ